MGNVGGGELQKRVCAAAREVLAKGSARTVHYSLQEEQLGRLYGPIGLDLGGREPAQIALAILAEIEMVRHGGSGRSRSEAMKHRN